MMKITKILSAFLLSCMISTTTLAASVAVNNINGGKVSITPANPTAPAIGVKVLRTTDRGDTLTHTAVNYMARPSNTSLYDAQGRIYATGNILIQAHDPEVLGGLFLTSVVSKTSFLNASCAATINFSILRNKLESYHDGNLNLVSSDLYSCNYAGLVDADVTADLHNWISHDATRKAVLLVGPHQWNDNAKQAVTLEFWDMNRFPQDEGTLAIEDDASFYEEITGDNLDAYEAIMFNHPGELKVDFYARAYLYQMPL